MEAILSSLQEDWQAFLEFSPKLLYALVVLVLVVLLGRAVSRLAGRLMNGNQRLRHNEQYVRRLIKWAARVVGILLALGVLGLKGVAASLLATGGVVAIVLGFAFREIGENLLAGIFLAFSRPFEVGDLIKTGDLTGTVRSIDIRSVHLRTFDACDVFVPSAQIFSHELFNWTRDGLRRPSFKVGVAYHDEPSEVVELLTRSTRDTDDVLEKPAAFVQIEEFAENFLVYEVFFWVNIDSSRRDMVAVTNDVKTRCWRALRDAGMTFSTDVTSALEISKVAPLHIDQSSQGTAD